jgi:uncharacterized surface anchored protein
LRRPAAIFALLLLTLALVLPGAALAAEPTSSYTPATTPKSGTEPSKESKAPSTSNDTTPTTTTPTTETKASTLPFTGFDLRWSLAIGVVLMGAGFSIVAVQRRGNR